MKRIVLTGGGTAGHVTPNMALIPQLRSEGWDVQYIGTAEGIERELITGMGVEFHPISAGKLRRYMNLRNLTDPFRVVKGLWQASQIIRRLRPTVVFSKGGFVGVPVVTAAWFNRVPAIAHESDLTPGLANRLSAPFVTRICVTFPETLTHVAAGKAVLTGSPVRRELLQGERMKGLRFAGLEQGKPVIMVMGGSLGATHINHAVREALPDLLPDFQVAHICGKGKTDPSLNGRKGYRQFEYVSAELADLMAASDLVVSRAGANFIFELLALRKPNLLIPLPKGASRGDQILNAQSFAKQGYSMVLPEEEMKVTTLLAHIRDLYSRRVDYVGAMERSALRDGVAEVMRVIREVAAEASHASK